MSRASRWMVLCKSRSFDTLSEHRTDPHPAFTVRRTTRPFIRASRRGGGRIIRSGIGTATMGKGSRYSLRFLPALLRKGWSRTNFAHLHPASIHPRAATGYWPYDMLTNIPMFWQGRLSTWTLRAPPETETKEDRWIAYDETINAYVIFVLRYFAWTFFCAPKSSSVPTFNRVRSFP